MAVCCCLPSQHHTQTMQPGIHGLLQPTLHHCKANRTGVPWLFYAACCVHTPSFFLLLLLGGLGKNAKKGIWHISYEVGISGSWLAGCISVAFFPFGFLDVPLRKQRTHERDIGIFAFFFFLIHLLPSHHLSLSYKSIASVSQRFRPVVSVQPGPDILDGTTDPLSCCFM